MLNSRALEGYLADYSMVVDWFSEQRLSDSNNFIDRLTVLASLGYTRDPNQTTVCSLGHLAREA